LAQRGEEGRGKLRKASGSRKQALIRGYPNGATRQGYTLSSPSECIARRKRTGGSEPSQYPQEEKTRVIPSVAASERGRAQTGRVSKPASVALPGLRDVAGIGCGRSGELEIIRLAEGLWNEPP
jgi:hypothetical protein